MGTGDQNRVGCAVWLVLAGDLLLIPAAASVLHDWLGPGLVSAVTTVAVALGLLTLGPLLLARLDDRDERRLRQAEQESADGTSPPDEPEGRRTG